MVWQDSTLHMLDQRLLPLRTEWVPLTSWRQVESSIRDMVVRGAPAIGIAAAYGIVLAALEGADLSEAAAGLAASRPTAVNLFWALDRMGRVGSSDPAVLLQEAQMIESEDLEMNQSIGRNGAEFVRHGARILTICNTGALATAGHGTALGIIRTAHADGKEIFVYSCETRPRQQGLRLTAWELTQDRIPFKSIVDGAACSLMAAGQVDLVVAGADRIAANGDSANKIGTFALAVQAAHFGIPFYIAAPSSTLDPSLPDGTCIPIEERAAEEITTIEGQRVAPEGCPVWNPGFDVTPAALIRAIITERAAYRAPYEFLSH